jgi:hypothetical protein
MQNMLKGWCACLRWADKVLHSDFFHTAEGPAQGAAEYFNSSVLINPAGEVAGV